MPRKSWSKKDERQYQHIKRGERQRGRSEERAEEIAARTVNKQRRTEGRTSRTTTSGTGNPNLTLGQRTKQELLNRARQLGIAGRSTMNKNQLVRAIRQHA
jgi:hypothetical protein